VDLFTAAPSMSLLLKYVSQSNQLEYIYRVVILLIPYVGTNSFLIFCRLKIKHQAHGSYAFTLENGAVRNNTINMIHLEGPAGSHTS
jgi:hypothetical protein